MNFITTLLQNQAVAAAAAASLISSIATLVLIFAPSSTIQASTNPIVKVLNTLAGNVGSNK